MGACGVKYIYRKIPLDKAYDRTTFHPSHPSRGASLERSLDVGWVAVPAVARKRTRYGGGPSRMGPARLPRVTRASLGGLFPALPYARNKAEEARQRWIEHGPRDNGAR